MKENEYLTTDLDYGSLEKADLAAVREMVEIASREAFIEKTQLILNFVKEFGDQAWEVARQSSYANLLDQSERMYDMMKKKCEDELLPDPRLIRKYRRIFGAALGIAKHGDEIMDIDPKTGQFKLTYEIFSCPLKEAWEVMGLSLKLQHKICSASGNAGDQSMFDFFGVWFKCDQALPAGGRACRFAMWGPKTKEEHKAWGRSLSPDLRKYYHPWPWNK